MAKEAIEIQPGFEPGSSEFRSDALTNELLEFWHWRRHIQSAAITQFTGGSTKYFGIYHAEFPKPKRDPA